jgi:neutral ceramidase
MSRPGRVIAVVFAALTSAIAIAAPPPLQAGLAVRDISPDTETLHVPLGGYGERMNAPATGVHDRTMAKALILKQGDKKFAFVAMDLVGIPRSLRDEILLRIQDTGIRSDDLLLAASHTHASVEMAAMNRQNVFENPAIGIFDEKLLDFTAQQTAEAIIAANEKFEIVRFGSTSLEIEGMNRNRRGGRITDNEMTIFRLDRLDGKPFVVHINYTAHPTFMNPSVMEVSAGWPGYLQREVEGFMPGVTCLYSNGAEGDIAPSGGDGPSPFAKAEDYGRKLAVQALEAIAKIKTTPVVNFDYRTHILRLPPRTVPPALKESAGPEYGLDEKNIEAVINAMAPQSSYIGVFRLNDFVAVSIPGEMAVKLGLQIKKELGLAGARYPVIVGLGNEWISYILPPEEYHKGGYEPGVSFYGENLGPVVTEQAITYGKAILGK